MSDLLSHWPIERIEAALIMTTIFFAYAKVAIYGVRNGLPKDDGPDIPKSW